MLKYVKFFELTKLAGFFGVFICLMIMYTTRHGIPGIRKYDKNFRLLDMQFHYTGDTVYRTFEKIGPEGRKAYRNFWILDFIFITCLLIVMLTISVSVNMDVPSKYVVVLIWLCLLRAIFDILENCILLHLAHRFPVKKNLLATICSYITTCKFIALYVWLTGIGVSFLFPFLKK